MYDLIYKYMNINLCFGLITLLVLIVVFYNIKSCSSIVEGFNTDMNIADISKLVDKRTAKIANPMYISKYRGDYEDTLINLHNLIGVAILNEIIDNIDTISNNPTSKTSLEHITKINELEKFKSTINETMEVVDKN